MVILCVVLVADNMFLDCQVFRLRGTAFEVPQLDLT